MDLPQLPSFSLKGKRALITGASSGIGLAGAAGLAAAGAEVVVAARRLELLEELVSALRERGHTATSVAMDIADVEATSATLASLGRFDILLNSAGLARHGPALATLEADFDAVMAVNLKGAFFLSRNIAARAINEGKPASIINISSQMGQVGGVDRSVYCASKFALEGFTKAAAIEWGGAGVRINTVAPTFIRTELTRSTFDNPKRAAWINSKIKLGRPGEVEDLMGAMVYLASDASSMVTGTSLLVDGGWTAG